MVLLINAVLLVPYFIYYFVLTSEQKTATSFTTVFNVLGLAAAIYLRFRKAKESPVTFPDLYVLLLLTELLSMLLILLLAWLSFNPAEAPGGDSIIFKIDPSYVIQGFFFMVIIIPFAMACIGWGLKKLFFN